LIAAAVVGGVAVAVTAGVVVYRMLTASRPAADPSADLAAHLPAPEPASPARPGSGTPPTPTPAAPAPAPAITIARPTGPLGGTPTGSVTYIRPALHARNARDLRAENDSAVILARNGYRTHQNPTDQQVADARSWSGDTGDPAKDPDYLVEGRVFDCYAPNPTKQVRGIWTEAGNKVRAEQTQRVAIYLQDWLGDIDALRQQFAAWPIEDMKEVVAIMNDQIVPIWNVWGEQ
jgi:hypothetical protein